MKKRYIIIILIGVLCACGAVFAFKFKKPQTDNKRELLYLLTTNYSIEQLNKSMNDTQLADELRKKTGINVRFIHPSSSDIRAELLMRIASSSMPDIVEMSWSDSGGPEQALDDEIIIPLNEVIKMYSPNFRKYIDDNPEKAKEFMTDSGVFYAYPFVRVENYLGKYQGPVLRRDWLDDLGLSVPETVDEWEYTLRQFKGKKGAKAPFALKYSDISNGFIVGAYGIGAGYYNDEGTIKFGPYEDNFRYFLERMASWYSQGLIDKSFMSMTVDSVEEKLFEGKSGAALMIIGSGLGKLEQNRDRAAPPMVAAQYPVMKSGDRLRFGAYDSGQCNVAITAACRDIPEAAKFLDYGYGSEGMLTYNFGIEGVSYEMKDGKPQYTDLITKNPDYIMQTVMGDYIRGNYNGPFIQMGQYLDQYFISDTQKEAAKLWAQVDSDKTVMPRITYTGAEKEDMIQYDSIESYSADMIKKMIVGLRPVSEFDEFRNELDAMGLQQALAIKQQAYERYLKRGK